MVLISVSAPGKAILHGEHAVVYGKAAIAMSVSLKTRLNLISNSDCKVVLHLPDLGVHIEWDLDVLSRIECFTGDDVNNPSEAVLSKIALVVNLPNIEPDRYRTAVLVFLYLYTGIVKQHFDRSLPAFTIQIDSELSVGAGMGSSASYSVCWAAAMLMLCGKIKPVLSSEDKDLICKWAFQAEKIFHGNPSGIDNSICTYGGALLFKEGRIAKYLDNIPEIKMLIVNTKLPRNTKDMVSRVKQNQQLHPSVIEPVMEAINAISLQSWEVLQKMSSAKCIKEEMLVFQDLIRMNHHLLNCLNVGHPRLNQICEIAESYQCAAKLTGGGGGGCALIVIPPDDVEKQNRTEHLKKKLIENDFEFWDVYLGSTGVEIAVQEM